MELRQSLQRAALGPALVEADGGILGRYRFSPEFTGFSGHFPGNPVLPAVVQLLIAHVLVEERLGRPVALRRVENAKFLLPIGPAEDVQVAVRPHARKGPGRYEATLEVGGTRAATFTLTVDL